MRIPYDVLIALSNRALQFQMQPYHYLIRLAHILSMSAFFGGVLLLDLRLIGVRWAGSLRPFAVETQRWLVLTFAVAFATGVLLFVYEPVQVGSHAYFTPKLLLIALALANVAQFHRGGYAAALLANGRLPPSARLAGLVSMALWTGVLVCACLNGETVPKVMLR